MSLLLTCGYNYVCKYTNVVSNSFFKHSLCMKNVWAVFIILFLCSCESPEKESLIAETEIKKDTIEAYQYRIYTDTSVLPNQYIGFSSPKAVNRIAEMENEYFNNFQMSHSKYYGTVWGESASGRYTEDSSILLNSYKSEVQAKGCTADSMHCTLYAMEALEAGLDTNFQSLEEYHKNIYKDHEHAGWSVGYILVKYFNWNAYLMVSKNSEEYDRCIKYFNKSKEYYVWNQPAIPLQGMYNLDDDYEEIDSLLKEHEFGWGFSRQGWHTWITRYEMLKECYWGGAPSKEYCSSGENNLFSQLRFIDYYAYQSHIIVFPPKREEAE